MLKELGLYLQTARYYRATQIAARLRLIAKAKLIATVPELANRRYKDLAGFAINPQFSCFERATDGQPLATEAFSARVSQMRQRRFTFLNLEKELGAPIAWDPADTTRLWRYNLHYFEYALDIARVAAANRQNSWAAELLGQIFKEWISANPVGCGVGWHSYPIARRIVNWVQAYCLAKPANLFRSEKDADAWQFSLYQQALYLEDHLEFDCLGNHLLANGKALLFAGLFFAGKRADRWFRQGEYILWRGLEEQIHADGGHEERSPMYQTIVLQDYLECVAVLRLNHKAIPGRATQVLIGMADFVDGIRHPDGAIALFADSAFSIAQDPDDVLAAASELLGTCGRWPSAQPGLYSALIAPRAASAEKSQRESPRTSIRSWPDTGYFKLRGAKEDQLIVDARPMGPQHLPAHGHCSLFSYELSLDGKRFIVDSGVEEYHAGPWRDFWRSTRAHNTLTVDGEEQTEIWSSFRAARRTQVQECSYAENEFGSIFVGRHSGFAPQNDRTPHRRIIAGLREGIWLVFDQIVGCGEHLLDSYIHLHPRAWCEIEGNRVELGRDSTRLRLYPLEGAFAAPITISSIQGGMDPIQGWYAPEFGKREPNPVLRLSSNTKLPAQMGYLIAPHEYNVQSWKLDVEGADTQVAQVRISINLENIKIERLFEVQTAS